MSRGFRRYVYTAALVALLVFLAGCILAIWQFVGGWAGGGPPVVSLTVTGVALVVWGVHEWLAGRATQPFTMAAAAERSAAARKAYLALGQLGATAAAVAQAFIAVRFVLLHLFGDPMAAVGARVVALAAGALIALLVWGFLRWHAARDDDFGREIGVAASWRRAYVYLTALAGSALTIGGAGELLRTGVRLARQFLAPDVVWRAPLAGAVAALVVGIPLATAAWRRADRAVALAPAAEVNALSRVGLRYAGLLFGTGVTLISAAYLMTLGVVVFLGDAAGSALVQPLFGILDWPWAAAYLPVGLGAWLSFGRGIRADAAWGGECPRTAALRRLVRYGVAAITLGAFWFGLTQFARLILQVALGAPIDDPAEAAAWWDRFAQATALTLVAAPAWWGHWWSQQARARALGPEGYAERTAAVRRLYLRGVTLGGAALAAAALGFAAFLALNAQAADALGGPRAGQASAAAAAGVALIWALAHGLTWRGDRRWLAAEAAAPEPIAVPPALPTAAAEPRQAEGPRSYRREDLATLAADAGIPILPQSPPQPALVIIDGADGVVGAALLAALHQALPDVVLWPMGLNAAAQVAMLEALGAGSPPAVPADAISRATAVLGPADILAPGGLDGEVSADVAAALAATSARVLLLPPRATHLRWVAAPNWPLRQWIENAVIEAAHATGRGD